MGVYGVNGEQINAVFGEKAILPLSAAYDLDGNAIFPTTPKRLKVMTYNCGEWYYGGGDNVPADKDSEYFALQSGMIERNNPDVLLIQEYWVMFSKLGRTAMSMLEQFFPFIYPYGGDSGYYGHCICSKYPISDYTVHTYTDNNNRYYDSCTITVIDTPITFVNTHLDTNSTKRQTELGELITYLQSLDTFVCAGDFNTLQCLDTSGEDYTTIITPLLNAGFHLANCSNFGFLVTYVDGGYTGCLDNIVTSANITILTAEVDTTKLSDNLGERPDHLPLFSVVEINEEELN